MYTYVRTSFRRNHILSGEYIYVYTVSPCTRNGIISTDRLKQRYDRYGCPDIIYCIYLHLAVDRCQGYKKVTERIMDGRPK